MIKISLGGGDIKLPGYKVLDGKFGDNITKLDYKDNSIDEVHIAGLNTECCVLATANAFFEANIKVKVLAKYCTTDGGREFHRAGLKVIKRLIGGDNIINKL